MANEWFIQVMGDEQGPLTAAQLKKLAANGTINADTLVRRGPTGDWVLAERVQGLFTSDGDPPRVSPPPIQPFAANENRNQAPSAVSEKSTNATAATPQEIEAAVRSVWRKFVYLIDPMFERYLTPWIVRFTWLLLLVGSVLLVGKRGRRTIGAWGSPATACPASPSGQTRLATMKRQQNGQAGPAISTRSFPSLDISLPC